MQWAGAEQGGGVSGPDEWGGGSGRAMGWEGGQASNPLDVGLLCCSMGGDRLTSEDREIFTMEVLMERAVPLLVVFTGYGAIVDGLRMGTGLCTAGGHLVVPSGGGRHCQGGDEYLTDWQDYRVLTRSGGRVTTRADAERLGGRRDKRWTVFQDLRG